MFSATRVILERVLIRGQVPQKLAIVVSDDIEFPAVGLGGPGDPGPLMP
jgi:hypothetical protein